MQVREWFAETVANGDGDNMSSFELRFFNSMLIDFVLFMRAQTHHWDARIKTKTPGAISGGSCILGAPSAAVPGNHAPIVICEAQPLTGLSFGDVAPFLLLVLRTGSLQ
jgi:hypothetical protein